MTASTDHAPQTQGRPEVPQEDILRADLYRLMAGLLSAPPAREMLDAVADLRGDDTPLGQAISTLAHLASRSEPATVSAEFQELFIGVGRGELVPYGSYYLTGFLHEKPLAKLRSEMARLGIEREEGVSEPEDHIASVLEIMAGLIDGSLSLAPALDEQQAFYEQHVGAWAPHFFADLEGARNSLVYAAVGEVGRRFLEIEEAAFRMG